MLCGTSPEGPVRPLSDWSVLCSPSLCVTASSSESDWQRQVNAISVQYLHRVLAAWRRVVGGNSVKHCRARCDISYVMTVENDHMMRCALDVMCLGCAALQYSNLATNQLSPDDWALIFAFLAQYSLTCGELGSEFSQWDRSKVNKEGEIEEDLILGQWGHRFRLLLWKVWNKQYTNIGHLTSL